MQLSKQEFSKLSKRDQNLLIKKGSKKAPSKKQQQKFLKPKSKSGPSTSNRQASVAAAYATRTEGRAPRVTASRDSCRVVHREFIGNITGTTAYTLSQQLAVNPGLAATFPWLSVMAQAWEEYKFHKLRFCYYTRTGSNTPGSVLLSPDYDASDAPPSSEQIQSSYDETVEDAPWKDMCCALKANLMNGTVKRHYVRQNPLGVNQDVKLYDVANFFVGTVDGTAVSWGKLWVEYDCEFFIPQLPPAGQLPFGGISAGNNTQTGANPFGVAPLTDAQALGYTINNASQVTFTSLGDYVVGTTYIGTVITVIPAPVTGAGITLISSLSSFPTAATTGTQVTLLRVTALAGATASFSLTATTVTGAILSIGQAPTNSLS